MAKKEPTDTNEKNLKVSKDTWRRLTDFKLDHELNNMDEVVRMLLQNQGRTEKIKVVA